MDLPRTPVNKYTFMDVEDNAEQGSRYEETSRDSSGDYKVHPAAPSPMKKHARTLNESLIDSDVSLDCVIRTNVPLDRGQNKNEILDNMDINKMFDHSNDKVDLYQKNHFHNKMDTNDEDDVIKMNHSPIKIDISSPMKISDDVEGLSNSKIDDVKEPLTKKPRLQLETAPNLQKDSNKALSTSNEGNNSPVAIDMVDPGISPNKLSQQLDDLKTIEIQRAILETTGSERHTFEGFNQTHSDNPHNSSDNNHPPTTPHRNSSEDSPDLHKLTPLFNTDLAVDMPLKNIDDSKIQLVVDDHNGFKVISERNKELVEQINGLNKKLNISLSAQEHAIYNFKLLQLEYNGLSKKYNTEIEDFEQQREIIESENTKYKDRIEKFRRKITEFKDEISMLNQNQKILQNKYDQTSNESEKWKLLHEEIADKHTNLEKDFKSNQQVIDQLKDDNEKLNLNIRDYELQIEDLNNKILILTEENTTLKSKLELITQEFTELQNKLEEKIEEQDGAKNNLDKEVEELRLIKIELETQLDGLKTESITEKDRLETRINELKTDLDASAQSIIDITEKNTELQNNLKEQVQKLNDLNKQNEETNDDAEINKAQVEQLQTEILELKGKETYLNESIAKMEDTIEEWKLKYQEKCSDYDKNVSEVESLQVKCNNMDAEHLAELEKVHANVSLLQSSIEENNEAMKKLKMENEALKENTHNEAIHIKEADHSNKISESEIASLKKQIEEYKEQLSNKEQEINKRLKLLAEDLYVQYSSKHEQKVKLLKKGYDTKYQTKIEQLTLQNEGHSQEIEQLKQQLSIERKEKQKVLQLLEKE